MRAILVTLVAFAAVCNGADYLTEPPDFLPSCKVKEPEFVKCSTRSIQELFNKLSKGIPGIIPSIDPFEINKVSLEQSGTDAANIKVDLTNVKIKGFAHTKVIESKVDPKDFGWVTKFRVPNIRLDADYAIDGRVLLLPLQGKGDMFLEIEDLKIIIYVDTRLYEKGDFTFWNITKVRADVKPTNLKSRLNNLFNGNKELEESTNLLFNDDWKTFFEALKPTVLDTFEKLIYQVLEQVFTAVPANFFIPDIPKSTELYA